MNKFILTLALLIPAQLMAADDSVYSWGDWSQGVMPAAGNQPSATPAPAQKPNINFRPNEASEFGRSVAAATPAPVPAPPITPVTVTVPAGTDLSNTSPTQGFFK
ncbi:MAG: hypothetical protein OQL06_06890 [Gammaproteobacteria bacterium]|nr:hypothetical protein [Gammaproteobacteria bacterium]